MATRKHLPYCSVCCLKPSTQWELIPTIHWQQSRDRCRWMTFARHGLLSPLASFFLSLSELGTSLQSPSCHFVQTRRLFWTSLSNQDTGPLDWHSSLVPPLPSLECQFWTKKQTGDCMELLAARGREGRSEFASFHVFCTGSKCKDGWISQQGWESIIIVLGGLLLLFLIKQNPFQHWISLKASLSALVVASTMSFHKCTWAFWVLLMKITRWCFVLLIAN